MQEKSQNLSGKKEEESMTHEKMSCINGCMVKSNLVISLVAVNHFETNHFENAHFETTI